MISEQASNLYSMLQAALTSKRNVEKDHGISGLGIAVSHVGRRLNKVK